jgi:VanZ family protein
MFYKRLPKALTNNLLWLVWAVFILYVLLLKESSLPRFSFGHFKHADKVVHAFLFFVLACLVLRALWQAKMQGAGLTKKIGLVVLLCTAYGAVTELLQLAADTGRTASFADFAADTAGVITGVFFYKSLFINGNKGKEIQHH